MYEIIEDSKPVRFRTINEEYNVNQLIERYYFHVYREFDTGNVSCFVDESDEFNVLIKLDENIKMEEALKCGCGITIFSCFNRPAIGIEFKGNNYIPYFILEMDNPRDIYSLNIFMKKRRVKLVLCIYDENGIIAVHQSYIQIPDEMMNSFKYYMEYSFYGRIPRIDYFHTSKAAFYVTVSGDRMVDKLVQAVDDIPHHCRDLNFDILVSRADEKIKIYFSGITEKNSAILGMINNKFTVLHFGTESVSGKPLLRYIGGRLYFFKENSLILNMAT